MKKILALLLALGLVIGLVGCSSNTPSGDTTEPEATEGFKIGFVTDVGGLGDQAYNDAVHKGVTQFSEEFGNEVLIVESGDVNDYADNLRALFNDGAQVAICASNSFGDAVMQVAQEYPDRTIIVFDATVEGYDNVISSVFKEEEAAYLLGVFAGLATQTNKVGYIAGIEAPLQERAMVGYEAGFYSVNPEGEVLSVYSGTYQDVGKGKEIANTFYTQGADYVAAFSGSVNLGVFQAAEEAGDGNYALGAALGQFDLSPDKIVASQVKTIDSAVYQALVEYAAGNTSSEVISRGIQAGGVDLLLNSNQELVDSVVSAEDLAKIEEVRQQIINGEIDIPTTKDELAEFKN